eukprot:767139-Hanusia_phi.AAC.5
MDLNKNSTFSSLGYSNDDQNIRKRALNPQLAADIFAQRSFKPGYASVESNFVARKYGISSKTVRDIWSRRTWIEATRPLWTAEEQDVAGKVQAGKETKHLHQKGGEQERKRNSCSALQDRREAKDMTFYETGSLQAKGWSSSTTSTFKQTSEESSDELSCKRSGTNGILPEGSSSSSSFQSQPEASSSGCTGPEHRGRWQEGPGCAMPKEKERHSKCRMERESRNENAGPSSSDAHNDTCSETGSSCPSASSAGQESRTQWKKNENKRSRESHARTRCGQAEQPSQGSLERQLPSQQSKVNEREGQPDMGRTMKRVKTSRSSQATVGVQSCGGDEIVELLRLLLQQQKEILGQLKQMLQQQKQHNMRLINLGPIWRPTKVQQRGLHLQVGAMATQSGLCESMVLCNQNGLWQQGRMAGARWGERLPATAGCQQRPIAPGGYVVNSQTGNHCP